VGGGGWPLRIHGCARPFHIRQLNSPHGAALIERAFRSQEGGRFAAENPNVGIGRLLAHNRGDNSLHSANLNFYRVIHCFAGSSSNLEGLLIAGPYGEGHFLRLGTGCYH
jgi:hypothetical protein